MMGFGLIFIVLFWGIIIAGAIWLGKVLLNKNGNLSEIFTGEKGFSSKEILENRYARGEISRDEFDLMKSDIE